VLKKANSNELAAFALLEKDPLSEFTPVCAGLVTKDGTEYMQLQNLLFGFTSPCGMDIKIGFRTYLPEDVSNMKPRIDLLEKFRRLDPTALTAEEEAKGVTKLRYMQHRERMSTSHTLGFRIEAVKRGCNTATALKGGEIQSREAVLKRLATFFDGSEELRNKFLSRLVELRNALVSSPFFHGHEIVGSSLLMLHDQSGNIGVWMIDFGKTVRHPERILSHDTFSHDHLAKREDGYLLGLDNLIAASRDCI